MEDKRGYKWLILSIVVVYIITGICVWYFGDRAYAVCDAEIDNVETDSEPTYNIPLSPINTRPEEKKEEPVEDPSELGVFRVTAYCGCELCCDEYGENRPLDENGEPIVYTAYGDIAKEGVTVAADPSVLKYRTQVRIFGEVYTVQDVGGNIKGNSIDLYFEDHNAAMEWGVRYAEVVLISEGEK